MTQTVESTCANAHGSFAPICMVTHIRHGVSIYFVLHVLKLCSLPPPHQPHPSHIQVGMVWMDEAQLTFFSFVTATEWQAGDDVFFSCLLSPFFRTYFFLVTTYHNTSRLVATTAKDRLGMVNEVLFLLSPFELTQILFVLVDDDKWQAEKDEWARVLFFFWTNSNYSGLLLFVLVTTMTQQAENPEKDERTRSLFLFSSF